MIDLRRYQALTFDCYGTLIDWEAGLTGILGDWARWHGLSVSAEELLAAFASAESAAEAEHPGLLYPELLRLVLRQLAARWEVGSDSVAEEALATSVGDWPPFADSREALRRLQFHYRLAILSNVDRASFARSNQQLGIDFDLIITAQDVGSYKPDSRNFLFALARLAERGIPRERVLHVAQSLFHDHVPARALGLHSVWIDRRRGRSGSGATPRVEIVERQASADLEFASLREFADAVDAAFTRV
jgi:2-haloacid dehalogenase